MAWDPFSDLERQLAEMRQRMLGSMGSMGGLGMAPALGEGRMGGMEQQGMMRMPSVDVMDEGNQFTVVAEIPGVNKDDIDVSVQDNRLIIRAEARREKEEGEKERGYIRQERSYTRFYRELTLPQDVRDDQVKATYKNGILEIRLPKREEKEQGRKVQIE